ncbi:MAG: hypothetical protein AAGC93_30740, partial [Cyanobacteria bacterium P01_F01_bin.53]
MEIDSDCASAYFLFCSPVKVLFAIDTTLLQTDGFVYRNNQTEFLYRWVTMSNTKALIKALNTKSLQ